MRPVLKWLLGILIGLATLIAVGLFALERLLPGWIEARVEADTGREFAIGGDFDIRWSLTPAVSAHDIRLANAEWSSRAQMLQVEHLYLRIDLLTALTGNIVIPELAVQGAHVRLERSQDGAANWQFWPEKPEAPAAQLPEIQELSIADTSLRYLEHGQATDVAVTVRAQPEAGFPLQASGEGRFRGEPFLLDFRGEALQRLVDPEQRYALDLQVMAGDTQARVRGAVLDPRRLGQSGLDLNARLTGPDLARLKQLTGLALPSLPPYELKGQLLRDGARWRLEKLDGTVGDSDLHGSLALDFSGELPRLTADLESRHLDLDDLGVVIGAPPEVGPEETASPRQRRELRRLQASERILPDDPLDLEAVRATNARVRFTGKRVQAGKLPIDKVTLDLRLEQGQLDFTPLDFHIGGGEVRNRIHIDATHDIPKTKWEAELERVDLRQVLRHLDIASDSFGRIGGRGKMWFHGTSVAEALSTADGGVYLLMSGGRLDHMLVEVAGLDASESLGTWLTRPPPEPIDCAYADLQARSGILRFENMIVDTADTLFTASGEVDLSDESVDIRIQPRPKDPSLLAVRSPLTVTGTLANPDLRPDEQAIVKAAGAALLGVVAGPAAALLPLIEPGTGGEAEICQGLVSRMQAEERKSAEEIPE